MGNSFGSKKHKNGQSLRKNKHLNNKLQPTNSATGKHSLGVFRKSNNSKDCNDSEDLFDESNKEYNMRKNLRKSMRKNNHLNEKNNFMKYNYNTNYLIDYNKIFLEIFSTIYQQKQKNDQNNNIKEDFIKINKKTLNIYSNHHYKDYNNIFCDNNYQINGKFNVKFPKEIAFNQNDDYKFYNENKLEENNKKIFSEKIKQNQNSEIKSSRIDPNVRSFVTSLSKENTIENLNPQIKDKKYDKTENTNKSIKNEMIEKEIENDEEIKNNNNLLILSNNDKFIKNNNFIHCKDINCLNYNFQYCLENEKIEQEEKIVDNNSKIMKNYIDFKKELYSTKIDQKDILCSSLEEMKSNKADDLNLFFPEFDDKLDIVKNESLINLNIFANKEITENITNKIREKDLFIDSEFKNENILNDDYINNNNFISLSTLKKCFNADSIKNTSNTKINKLGNFDKLQNSKNKQIKEDVKEFDIEKNYLVNNVNKYLCLNCNKFYSSEYINENLHLRIKQLDYNYQENEFKNSKLVSINKISSSISIDDSGFGITNKMNNKLPNYKIDNPKCKSMKENSNQNSINDINLKEIYDNINNNHICNYRINNKEKKKQS